MEVHILSATQYLHTFSSVYVVYVKVYKRGVYCS
jgi:hypothetical protein